MDDTWKGIVKVIITVKTNVWVKLILIIHVRIHIIQGRIMIIHVKFKRVKYKLWELFNCSATSLNAIYITHEHILIFIVIERQYLCNAHLAVPSGIIFLNIYTNLWF